jgi:uncharacterized protein YecT (DUF1311 family)
VIKDRVQFRFFVWILCAFTLFFVWLRAASAAEIETIPQFGGVSGILVRGKITQGDSARFSRIAEKSPRALVILESPGGLVGEAMSIGAEIRERGYATYVPPSAECYSACGIIWLSGVRRRMSESSVIGFHAVYVVEGDNPRETGMGNAELGSFLTHLGLTRDAIRLVTVAGPDDMIVLTPEIAAAYGIDYYVADDAVDLSPGFQASAPTLAYQTSTLMLMSYECANLFNLIPEKLRTHAEAQMRRGHDVVSGEKFGELISISVPAVKSEWIETRSQLRWCVQSQSRLLEQDIDVFDQTPSYDCRKSSTPTERAICGSRQLASYDRVLGSLYAYYLNVPDDKLVNWVRDTQRSWIKERNLCAGNLQCLSQIYQSRIVELLP